MPATVKKSFKSEPERLEFLFELYKKYIDAQPVVVKKRRKKFLSDNHVFLKNSTLVPAAHHPYT